VQTKNKKPYDQHDQEPFDAERLERMRARLEQAASLLARAEFRGLIEVADRGQIDKTGFRIQRVPAVTSDRIALEGDEERRDA
jgi:hypothetical protein